MRAQEGRCTCEWVKMVGLTCTCDSVQMCVFVESVRERVRENESALTCVCFPCVEVLGCAGLCRVCERERVRVGRRASEPVCSVGAWYPHPAGPHCEPCALGQPGLPPGAWPKNLA